MPIYNQQYTDAGRSAVAATGTGQQLVITRVAVGNGYQSNPAVAVGLANEQIHSITIAGNAVTTVGNEEISVIVSNAGVISGFNLTEYGIFGRIGGGPEQLFVYITDSQPIPIPAASSGLLQLYEYFGIAFANTANVTVTVATGAYALQAQFVQHLADPAAHPQAFQNPFNLATMGKVGTMPALNGQLSYYLGGDGKWHPGLPVLIANTTLYVATNGNDQTGVPGDPSHPFASIQGALNFLNGYLIAAGVVVTVQVTAGHYTGAAGTFNCPHPNGQNIIIIGSQNPDFTFTGIGGPITGSANNWQVPLTGVSSIANMSVGGWLIIWNTSTTANGMNGLLTGFFQITAISGNTVTIAVPFFQNLPSIVQQCGGSGTPVTTILVPNQNVVGATIGSAGIRLLAYLGVVPAAIPSANLTSQGIWLNGPSDCNYCGVSGYGNNVSESAGFWVENAICGISYCGSTNNGCGLVSTGGGADAGLLRCGLSHNDSLGMWCDQGASGSTWPDANGGSTFIAGTKNGPGFYLTSSSRFNAYAEFISTGIAHSTLWIAWNNGAGITMGYSSTSSSTSGDTIQSQNNFGNYDLSVYNLSVSTVLMGPPGRYINQAQGVLTANGLITNVS